MESVYRLSFIWPDPGKIRVKSISAQQAHWDRVDIQHSVVFLYLDCRKRDAGLYLESIYLRELFQSFD